MKKILFLISIVLLSACGAKSDGSDTVQLKEGTIPFTNVETFKYKKHSYIKFGTIGVVHDPECKYCYNTFD
jgi:Tfp pilus assembly protein PilP